MTKKASIAIILIITMITVMTTTINAGNKYIEKSFTFGSYAPTVIIHHPVYNWVLTAKGDKLTWQKPNGSNSQMFVILPTEYNGYYSFREFNNGKTEQFYIGYTKSGFKLVSNKEVRPDTIAYKFVWKKTDNCSGKTFNNVWRLSCKQNKISMCFSGCGSLRIEPTNY